MPEPGGSIFRLGRVIVGAYEFQRDHVGLDEAQGVVELAGGDVRGGGDEFDQAGVVLRGFVAYRLHQEPAYPVPPVVLGDDEHRHLDYGVAVGEVGFDPEANRPDHPAPVLHHEDLRPWRFQKFLEPLSHGLFHGWRVSDRLGQLPGQPLDGCSILAGRLTYLDPGFMVHGSPRSVVWGGTYPKSPGAEQAPLVARSIVGCENPSRGKERTPYVGRQMKML